MNRKFLVISAVLMSAILAACNITNPDVTPTPEVLITETPTLESSPTPSLTPTASLTPTQEIAPIVIASLVPTQPNQPVIDEAPPTATQGACVETVQSGDTLTIILLRNACGNAVGQPLIDAVVRANTNMSNANILPAPGSEILIPRPTLTPVPENFEITQTASTDGGIFIVGNQAYPTNQPFVCYEVEEGDTISDIQLFYGATLEQIAQLNPQLNWNGCNFTLNLGGPNCSPVISIGACVTVPAPTGTPVPSATPSGNETATPTPTYQPPRIISPPNGAIASGSVTLQWVSTGILKDNEVYLIQIGDRTAGTEEAFATRSTSYILPDTLIPTDGQDHAIEWRITVGIETADGTYQRVGGLGNWNRFQWRSR